MSWIKNTLFGISLFAAGYFVSEHVKEQQKYTEFFVQANYWNVDKNGNPEYSVGIWNSDFELIQVRDVAKAYEASDIVHDKLNSELNDALQLYHLSRERGIVDSTAIKNLAIAENRYDSSDSVLKKYLIDNEIVTGSEDFSVYTSNGIDITFKLK